MTLKEKEDLNDDELKNVAELKKKDNILPKLESDMKTKSYYSLFLGA